MIAVLVLSRLIRLLRASVAFVLLGAAVSAFSSQLVLRLPGVTPETSPAFAGSGWIAVGSEQIGMGRVFSATHGGPGPAEVSEMSLTHVTDDISAGLFGHVTAGTRFTDAHLREYTDAGVYVREWVMEEAFLTSFSQASGGSTVESFTLNFAKLTLADSRPVNVWFDFTAQAGGDYTTNTAPTLAAIADQSTPEDLALTVALTVGDAESPGTLAVGATSDNTTLLPATSFSFTGTGASRTLKLTPGTNQTGSANVTVLVTDGLLQTTRTFLFTVGPVNSPPTIGTIATQTTAADTFLDVAFTVADVDTALTSVTVTGSSSNTAVLPDSGINVSGTGTDRTVRLTPAAGAYGSVTVSLVANDGAANSTPRTFQLNVTPPPTAPTDIMISANTVAENSPGGTVIGTLSATDINGGPHTFELLSPVGGPFAISGTQLVVAAGANLDYETVTSYVLSIRATDSTGLTYTGPITINVTPVNEPPGFLGLPEGPVAVLRGQTVPLPGFSVFDPDATDLSVTLTAPQGTLAVSNPAAGVLVVGNGTSNLALSGPIAVLNATLSAGHLALTAPANFPAGAPETLSLSLNVSDNGQSGVGGPLSTPGLIPVRFYRHRIEQWREEHFSAAELGNPALEATLWGNTADPDGDGLNNVGEYAFDRDPRVSDAALAPQPVLAVAPDTQQHLHLVVVVRNDDPELTVRFESGDSPANLSVATVEAADSQPFAPGYDVRTLRDIVAVPAAPRRFIRAFVDLQYLP